jgi:glyoxylase-like metal-dependent hydrolase (beta-lactamase superfamily II)/rhodanese-related sulfurtransferase
MVEVVQIETPSLGDRSYLAHDHHVAVVIDPQRDIDRVLALAGSLGVRITHVAETHIHNDYVTGGLALSEAAGAEYLVNAGDPVAFRRSGVTDGDRVSVGELELRVLATPGHTFTHLSYVLATGGEVSGVFTGGSLLYGATGRPDLLGAENTPALARAQYASAQRLARDLPDQTEIFPTHGFGSFCAAGGSASGQVSTIGTEKLVNSALTLGECAYTDSLLAGLDAWPAYYAHMGPANLAGPGRPDLSPPRRADPAELRRRIEAGEWVIDLRDRTAFAAGFLPGTVNFPLGSSFATCLGWTVPWGAPVTLLGETPEQVTQAQRELARIGFDRLAAAASGTATDWAGGRSLASLRLASFADLATAKAGQASSAAPPGPAAPPPGPAAAPRPSPTVLDVRRRLEWQEGHLAGAVHVPLFELSDRLADVPAGEIWVHCQSGYRALVAASMLAARGRQVVAVDDDFDNAAAAGLPLERG